ncbi:unnamed protein product [Symbiodinium sp. CCMP2456]|nr:unnamed protein product [Symbiodinium sp. CCMP2456]
MGAGGSCVHGHVQVRATANPHWHVPVQSVQSVQVQVPSHVEVRTHVPVPVSPPVPCSPVIPVSCPPPVKWDVGISAEERLRIQQWAAQVSSQVGFTVSPSMYWTCHSMDMDVLSGLSSADRWRMQHFLSGHCGHHCCSRLDVTAVPVPVAAPVKVPVAVSTVSFTTPPPAWTSSVGSWTTCAIPLATEAPLPPPADPPPGCAVPFFQKLHLLQSQVSALNNAIGWELVTQEDMAIVSRHCGEVDQHAMAAVLQLKRTKWQMSLGEVQEPTEKRATGFVQYRPEARQWLAYRRWHGAVWRLDALKEAPEQISEEQLRQELAPYKKSTFCICEIA